VDSLPTLSKLGKVFKKLEIVDVSNFFICPLNTRISLIPNISETGLYVFTPTFKTVGTIHLLFRRQFQSLEKISKNGMRSTAVLKVSKQLGKYSLQAVFQRIRGL
jgi:hypothetical protein